MIAQRDAETRQLAEADVRGVDLEEAVRGVVKRDPDSIPLIDKPRQ